MKLKNVTKCFISHFTKDLNITLDRKRIRENDATLLQILRTKNDQIKI